jgi:ribosomal protein S18 acetylase RimI-like enzyme
MVTDTTPSPTRALPNVTFSQVTDMASRMAFCHINSAAFELPLTIVRDVYGDDEAWHHALSGWVAFSGAEPVATAATLADEHSVGLYSVGVVPRARHRGFAEAITRHAIEQATRHTSVNRIILQSSPSGYRLYRRLNFREVTRFLVYSAPETLR